ncbi:DUF4097 domain-containing protein [Cryobacterium psychrophilum]|uniref:DUF4097 domain-containing protein n=1 Tax=Cryobacterium psychrophilum TaxID=41988 RepID=UPI0010CF7A63|nr:DUF4097 domain-containing protein [Cryobacterium psychrophilum]TDW30015.1 hypothetical protein EDD25_1748 [Cryobacterium psychrophilum]
MSLEKWLVFPGQTKIIDIDLVRRLKLGMIGGTVDVIGHDEPGARIEVHSVSGKGLKISMNGDALEIDHVQLRWDNFIDVFGSFRGTSRAEASILVPRDVAMTFGVVSAEALVSGLHNDARLSTVSGSLVVDAGQGHLEINAVSAEVSVRNHEGTVNAHTVTGEFTASGRIRRFGLDGVTSNVFLDLEGTPDEITTNTVSGNLTVRLAADVAARYRLNTISGTLQLDDQTVRGTFGKPYESSNGALNGAWVELRANSVSGDISVVRRDTTADPDADRPTARTAQTAPPTATSPTDSGEAAS